MSDDQTKNAVKGAIEAIYAPIESIVKTLAGPAAEEIGLSLRDSVQAWRLKRQIRLFERVKKICEEAGIKPQAVKMSLLFEIMEKGSLEENDELQDIWANMLSNAADPKRASLVTTAFPEILKQLCIEEVRFLNKIFATNPSPEVDSMDTEENDFTIQYVTARLTGVSKSLPKLKNIKIEHIDSIHCDNLKRLGLINVNEALIEKAPDSPTALTPYILLSSGSCSMTALGYGFIRACSVSKRSNKPAN
jgi:Abortive infection alpha